MENSSPNPSFSICDIQIQKRLAECFAKSFPQKIVFAKLRPHCSATCPNTWRAEHQRKMSFPLSRKISPPPNQKCKECFFFRGFRRVREAVAGLSSSVRFSFASPRAPRVRIGFQLLIFDKVGSSGIVKVLPLKHANDFACIRD